MNHVFAGYQNDFEATVSRFAPKLFRVALRRLHNVEDAEDAVQDALLSAYKHIGQFEGRSQLSTWLITIVINFALMTLRQSSRLEILSIDHDFENDDAVVPSELRDMKPNPETICAQAEMAEKVHRVLEQLSPKQRNAMQMCELDGFSVREAAKIMGISTNTLKSRVLRARRNLRVIFGEIYGVRPAGKAAPVVDRLEPTGAAAPIGLGTPSCKPNPASVCGHNETHNYRNQPIEHAQNCYPPHNLESTSHLQPQSYAT
jgi:RNA polymerase sigma-70 factor (ECF subfamily)